VTTWGFRSLAALLGLGLFGGGWLVLNSFFGANAVERMSCAEWMAEPREGRFELMECVMDGAYSRTNGSYVIAPVVGAESRPRLYTLTDDPVLRTIADRLERDGGDAATELRTRERFAAELQPVRTVEGTIERAENWADVRYVQESFDARYRAERDYVLHSAVLEDTPLARSFGVVLMLFCGPCFAFLFFAQRRWRGRADDIRRKRAGSAKPVVF
jgi:hypothetical protein